ncbi:hypothetical protein [Nocardia sp. NBC_00403]|uniref:hypothetical protein n=1 Tax=Nocardia sp. NBC_00403 TaxID=2975990 RepID=UPI002E1A9057
MTLGSSIAAAALVDGLGSADSETAVRDLEYFLDDERRLHNGVHGPEVPTLRLLSDVLDTGQRAAGPAAPAVVCGARPLTDGELDRLSNRLAHGLIESGAGPGVVASTACNHPVLRTANRPPVRWPSARPGTARRASR